MKLFFHHIKGIYSYIIMSISILVIALGLDAYFSSENHKEIIVKRFQENFIREQNELDLRIDDLIEKSQKNNDVLKIFFNNIDELHNLSANRFMYFYLFSGDSMVFWSDNRIVEAEILPILTNDNQLLQLTNGWFYTEVRSIGPYKIIALLLIKNNYTIQNSNLINEFNPSLHLPKETRVKSSTRKVPNVIFTKNSKPVFSLVFSELYESEEWIIWILVLMYSISFGYLVVFYRKLATVKTSQFRKFIYIIVGGILVLFLTHLMAIFKMPPTLYKLKLFQQFQFSLFFNYFKSLGDIFLTSITCFYIFFNLYTEIHPQKLIWNRNIKFQKLIGVVSLIAMIIYFVTINKVFDSIIYHTDVSFNIKDLFASGYMPIFGILAVAVLLSIFIFMSDYVIQFFLGSFQKKYQLSLPLLFTILISYIYSKNKTDFDLAIPLLILANFYIIIYTRLFIRRNYRYIHIVFLVLLFSGYSVYTIYNFSKKRDEKDEKAMAATLLSEHDPVAEYLITDLNKSIRSDTVLRRKVSLNEFDFPWIYKYVRKKYFSGYWERYDLQVTLCSIYDSLLLKPAKTYQPCISFFNSIFQNEAEEILGTDFYFLKNANGHISYLSEININKLKSNEPINIYIQLDSKLNADELGYPELLIDKRFINKNRKQGYSYAKYYNQKLIYASGEFLYNQSASNYKLEFKNYRNESFGNYNHLFYKPDDSNLIILSKPTVKIFDLLVSFSYLFIFYFIIFNFMLLSVSPNLYKIKLNNDFKTKIRVSVIGVLIFSLLCVGCITVYFIIRQFRNKQYDLVNEKLQSVYMELESNLSNENELSYNWNNYGYNNLEELLRRLSNIFSTDINLYDKYGKMIASSRPEILDKGLSGSYINPIAYFQLSINNKLEFVQNEKIGKMQFISMYSPFTNEQGQLLAYLNLPYFTKQSVFTQEISSILLAIVNFYVILTLLSLFLAVFISERITKPLKLIQERFAQIKLGVKSEKIIYNQRDEIGDIVEEYNRLVGELDHSIELLAKSERETAWREMAKQVAHEIKNPLTPMKLSIQQLQRAWNDKSKNLDDYFERVTKTIVEQIENLSKIATEFSNFAKMPKTNIEEIDLRTLISSIGDLFIDSGVELTIKQFQSNERYFVLADREQLLRVLINLTTNAVQSIPEGRKGKVEISLEKMNEIIQIGIKDNGMGIPNEILGKMYQPNFTTKSGGTGLGLALSKSIIENIKGTINFKTAANEGTTFFINLPVI